MSMSGSVHPCSTTKKLLGVNRKRIAAAEAILPGRPYEIRAPAMAAASRWA
jgi:hypothetical protein